MNIRYSKQEIGLFLEAWIFIALARLCILILSFGDLMKLIGRPILHQSINEPNKMLNEYFSYNQAIERASRYSFWRTKCFEQAVTAKWMLDRRGKTTYLYFGVKKDPLEKLMAHAWLTCDGEIATGGNMASDFVIISCFN